MNGGIWVVVGVLVGWILNEWTRWRYYKRERMERRLGIYQQSFSKVSQLRATLGRVTNYGQQIQPQLNALRQWWNQNSLFMDPDTNNALVGLVNTITMRATPRRQQAQRIRARNLLLIASVSRALDRAENAIKTTVGQAVRIAGTNRLRDSLAVDYVVANILTFFVFGAIAIWSFYVSGDRSLPAFSLSGGLGVMLASGVRWIITWLLLPIGFSSMFWAIIALPIIVFKYRIVERFTEDRLVIYKRWSDLAFFTALIVVFAESFYDVLAKTLTGGLPHYYDYILVGAAIIVLLITVAINLISNRMSHQ